MASNAVSANNALSCEFYNKLEDIDAAQWNRLTACEQPFLRHEFLCALERHECATARFGWHPCHLTVRNKRGELVGGMPMYMKTNSYGEFVFDWSWASAYQRLGREYYPKLIVAIPYTPITGARVLTLPDRDNAHVESFMIEQAIAFARENRMSGVHWLFTTSYDTELLERYPMALRMDCQYHWHNDGYQDFDHFLENLVARKRKKIKRERRRVVEQGIRLRVVHGDEADHRLWKLVHHFYSDTFIRKAGIPTLSLGFFEEIGRTMGKQVVLVLAEHRRRIVACAINLRDRDCLYGRFWGCEHDYHSLHFEACYYQGIDYCIARGLRRFEPGAQGEHKIARGFLPTRTWSAHWIADAGFERILGDFCRRERAMMEQECRALMEDSPYRHDSVPQPQSD